MKRMSIALLALHAASAVGQFRAPDEALKYGFDDYNGLAANHGAKCTRDLKKGVPGITGIPRDLEFHSNFAGIFTSRWRQVVAKPDGTAPTEWRFECVTQLLPDKKIQTISLAMYQTRGTESRGIEVFTRRDLRVQLVPR